jgi:hypothetical protein
MHSVFYGKSGVTAGWPGPHLGPVGSLLFPVSVPESSRSFPLLHVGPCRQFLSELDEALVSQDSALFCLSPRSLSSSRVWSLGFLESSLLHCMTCTGLQGHVKVLNELIPKVLLSMLKPCINTKLQNRHARMNLLYQGGSTNG